MTSINVDLSLHPQQKLVFDSKKRFRVVVAGRRFGKSWLAMVAAIEAAMDPRNVQKLPVFLIAPTYPSARVIYWKRMHDMCGGLILNSNVNLGLLQLANGVEIHIKGADRPDSLRGVGLWFVVIDEFADQKVDVWELIVRPALSDAARLGGGRALFIGTPKGRNHFYALAEHAKNDTTGQWELFLFTTADNPFIEQKEIESAASTISSSAFRQEYMASFESTGGIIFQRKWFKYDTEPKHGRFYIAIDLAGFVDVEKQQMAKTSRLDRSAIIVAKCDGPKWHIKDVIHGRWDVKTTADRIVQAVKTYEPVATGIEKGILKDAIAPFLQESMRKNNAMVHVTELSHGNKHKNDRVIWALQGRFEHGNITFEAEAPWLAEVEDEILNFPSKTVHDDIPDGLSYIDQLTTEALWEGWKDDEPEWQPLDEIAGF